jgi:predicted small lipoprotein YifL
MKKLSLALALILILMLALTACGGSDANTDANI